MLNLIGVIVAFVVIIVLIRKQFNFGLSLIIGSLIVGIFSLQEIPLIDIFKAFIEGSIYSFKEPSKNIILYSNDQLTLGLNTEIIELALLMTLIYVLAKLMQETGAITKLINSLRTFFTKGGVLGLIPAVYGLMPVPGGALFSAPMIKEEGEKYGLDKNQKNFLNIWFRHIWFPIYPISFAMITLVKLVNFDFQNIDISMIILANSPAFIAFILIGVFFLKRFIKNIPNVKSKLKKDYTGLQYLLPPIIPLISYVILIQFDVSKVRSFLIGIIFSIIILYFLIKPEKKRYIELVKKSLTIKLALAIFGIMIFREIIEATGASHDIAQILESIPMPTIWMIVILPLILGMITGYNLAAIGLSYPIVSLFFPDPINLVTLIGLTSLIFISSMVGYLISPIHLCNVLSSEYLKTDTTRMYRVFIPAAITLLVIQIVVVGIVIYMSSIGIV